MATNSPRSGFGPVPCFKTVTTIPLSNVLVVAVSAALVRTGDDDTVHTAATAALVRDCCKKSARVDVVVLMLVDVVGTTPKAWTTVAVSKSKETSRNIAIFIIIIIGCI